MFFAPRAEPWDSFCLCIPSYMPLTWLSLHEKMSARCRVHLRASMPKNASRERKNGILFGSNSIMFTFALDNV